MSRFTIIFVLSVASTVLGAPKPQQSQDASGIELLRYNSTNNNEAGYQFT